MTSSYEQNLAHFEQVVATIPTLERKGKTMPYTSVNGHMFAFLDKEGQFCLRLDTDTRTSFIEKYNTALAMQHGRVMKEYVVVPEKLLHTLEELSTYFTASHAYTSIIKPKPTKKS